MPNNCLIALPYFCLVGDTNPAMLHIRCANQLRSSGIVHPLDMSCTLTFLDTDHGNTKQAQTSPIKRFVFKRCSSVFDAPSPLTVRVRNAFWGSGDPRKRCSLENWSGNCFLRILQRLNTTRRIGIIFLGELARGQITSTSANSPQP